MLIFLLSYERLLAQFDTNVFGTVKVTQEVLPHFRQRKSGTVVFISSLSGWYGDPFTSAYSGSKFALEGTVVTRSPPLPKHTFTHNNT